MRLRARQHARHGGRDDDRARGSSLSIQATSIAREAPHLLRPDHVAALQSSAGNKTVQGLFGFGKKKPGGPSPLTWQNTQWANTRFLGASSEGTGGVLFAGARGKEVVVKPGETMDVEGAIATHLISGAAAAAGNGLGLAPGYRLVSKQETQQMEQAFKDLVPAAGKEPRVKTLVGKLSAGGVVVQDLAQGKPLTKALDDVPKHTKKRLFGGGARKLRKTSPMRVFTDVRAIRAMGAAHAADMLIGNDDRLKGFNMENIMVSPTSLQMIDHVVERDPRAHLRSYISGSGQYAKKNTVDSLFAEWKAHPDTLSLAGKNYAQVAAQIFQTLVREAPNVLNYDEILPSGKPGKHHGRDVDSNAIGQILMQRQAQFETVFAAGLAAGRAQVITTLNELLSGKGKLEEVAGGGDVTEVRRALELRRDFLLSVS